MRERSDSARQGRDDALRALSIPPVSLSLSASSRQYADNVLKTYATAVAIVLTCIVGCVQMGTVPSLGFIQGFSLVIASIFLYNLGPAAAKKTDAPPPPADEASEEA